MKMVHNGIASTVTVIDARKAMTMQHLLGLSAEDMAPKSSLSGIKASLIATLIEITAAAS